MMTTTLAVLNVLRREADKAGVSVELYAAEVLASLNWTKVELLQPVQLELPLHSRAERDPTDMGW